MEIIRNIESVVFVPLTLGSALKGKLQEMDEYICKATNVPSVRFMERGGPTLRDQVRRTNP